MVDATGLAYDLLRVKQRQRLQSVYPLQQHLCFHNNLGNLLLAQAQPKQAQHLAFWHSFRTVVQVKPIPMGG